MHAPPKSSLPVITPGKLEQYDAFLFGIPTRYGNFPTQWKAFFDHTGKQWTQGGYWGKYAGVFVSTATPGGGQESTVISAMSTLAHHGMIYVPLGYKTAFPILSDLEKVRGGSPWGAGTFAVSRTCCWFLEIHPSSGTMIVIQDGRTTMNMLTDLNPRVPTDPANQVRRKSN